MLKLLSQLRLCAYLTDSCSNGNNYIHRLYVVDSGVNGSPFLLNVYKVTQIVTDNSVTETQTFEKAIDLSGALTGGAGLTCFAAENNAALYLATNAGSVAAAVSLKDFSIEKIGVGFTPPQNVSSIFRDDNGFVILNFGAGGTAYSITYAANGALVQDGGGIYTLVNDKTPVVPTQSPY
jgi:hypothetical protein